MTGEYFEMRWIQYGAPEGPTFIPVCPICGRFVKADPEMFVSEEGEFDRDAKNATCKKDGRVQMLFAGYL